MVMRLLCCLLLIAAAPLWAATQLQASVDKNPVLAGEFFVLTISADDSINSEQPDTSVLLKDFVVGPTSVSSRTNIINGEISKQTNWSVKLMTRKEGTYTIPAFTVAGVSSKPIELTVAKRSQTSEQNKEAFIKTSIKPTSLYVQEAGVYTVKLYLDNNKELLDGNLTTPEMENAELTPINKQSEDYELIDGKRYLVITREYLVQPQKSGVNTITAPVFNGRIRQNYRQMAVSAMGEDVDIEIKPIPENYSGAWLPSELVNLDEQWQPKDDTVEVGTPITRTITLTALGVTKEQLPDIDMPQVQGFRSYPDEKESNHLVRDGRVISQQTASYALLPQTPGTYTLPEIKLPWFNTKINRISYATIPARTLTVVPSTNPLTPTAPAIAEPQTASSNELSHTPTNVQTVTQVTSPMWLIIVAIVGYGLWLVTLVLYIKKRPQQSTPKALSKSVTSVSLNELKLFAKQNNSSAFYNALNLYAKQYTGKNVAAIEYLLASLKNTQLNDEIAKLRTKLYSSADEQVDLSLIVNLLSQATKQTQSTSNSTELKNLYD
ncbi:BatD family protein [Pseudoalteromonas shioyasakiensis]|uniref:BatD family protein n=1 Tax=Pseudoalteromonas TaxID=53246 RepID=UPI001EFED202|nr:MULTISPECIES: BatD family protein [Pseudoalteromonas]MCG9708563.1 BatD family protein [Pseudoalteromonas sp. Isolate3]MCQ8882369.1 BatD family protein [Pseudoalteromonas shioyasakiensis]